MAIEIVSFPINSMVIFQFAMLNYQRVITILVHQVLYRNKMSYSIPTPQWISNLFVGHLWLHHVTMPGNAWDAPSHGVRFRNETADLGGRETSLGNWLEQRTLWMVLDGTWIIHDFSFWGYSAQQVSANGSGRLLRAALRGCTTTGQDFSWLFNFFIQWFEPFDLNQVQCGNDAVRIGRPRAVVELLSTNLLLDGFVWK